MSGAYQYCAFRSDPALKETMVDRVRAKWSQRQVFPLSYLKWRTDGGMISMSGALAETQVPDQFIERTGLPVELATLCEGLVYSGIDFSEAEGTPFGLAIEGSEAILAFAMEWLDAIPAGADLGGVVPRFMRSFLADVLGPDFAMAAHVPASVRTCGNAILGLWVRQIDGAQVAAKEWRSVRADALCASEDGGDPWGYCVSELVESLAWPAQGLAPEFVPIFQIFMKEVRQYLAAPYLSVEDREILKQSMVGLREVTRAQRDAKLSDVPVAKLLEHNPDAQHAVFSLMQPEMQARLKVAKEQAQPESDRTLRRQMDSMRHFIEATSQLKAN